MAGMVISTTKVLNFFVVSCVRYWVRPRKPSDEQDDEHGGDVEQDD